MGNLFKKVCILTIGDRQFVYPPMDIEFDQKIQMGTPPTTEVKLYNPNEDTISAIAKKNGTYGPKVTIDAGYEDEHGECVNGTVSTFSVKKDQVDKILTCTLIDETNKIGFFINKTYRNQTAENILKDILSKAGIKYSALTLGLSKTYDSFSARDFDSAFFNILKDTISVHYAYNGVMSILPGMIVRKPQFVYLLSPSSGLINVPEKALVGGNQEGIKFQTLFLYNLHAGSTIKIESKNVNGIYQIWGRVKKFSSFKRSECEFEALPA